MKWSIRASMRALFGLLGTILIFVGPVLAAFVLYQSEDWALEAASDPQRLGHTATGQRAFAAD